VSTSESSAPPIGDSAKQALIDTWQREMATTLRVLRAYPEEQSELRPHERAKNARELAWMFTLELGLAMAAVRGALDFSGGIPPAPERLTDVIAAYEKSSVELIDAIRGSDLSGTIQFLVAPKTLGDYTRPAFLWFLLHDQIHHRGQFSVYLRMSGGKVPSIYGPTADEPWR